MSREKKPMITPRWIEQCCQKNLLLDWSGFSIPTPIKKNQVKMEAISIPLSSLPLPPEPRTSQQGFTASSRRLIDEPTPPRPHQIMHSSGGVLFTSNDVDYLRKFLRWILVQDVHMKIATLSRELALRVGAD